MNLSILYLNLFFRIYALYKQKPGAFSFPVAVIILSLASMLFFGFLLTRVTTKLKLPNVTAVLVFCVCFYTLGLIIFFALLLTLSIFPKFEKYKTHTELIEALGTLKYIYHIEEMKT